MKKVAYPGVVSRALEVLRRARMKAKASAEDDLAIQMAVEGSKRSQAGVPHARGGGWCSDADSVEQFKPKRDLESESARQRFRICGCFLASFGSDPSMPFFLFRCSHFSFRWKKKVHDDDFVRPGTDV